MALSPSVQFSLRRSTLEQIRAAGLAHYREELELLRIHSVRAEQAYRSEISELQAKAEDSGVFEGDSAFQVVESFAMTTRYGHVLHICRLVEAAMDSACHSVRVANERSVPMFHPSELRGPLWNTRRLFLERYTGLSLSCEASEQMREVILVRNVIAHHNAETFTLSKKELAKLIAIQGVSAASSLVELDESFVPRAIDSAVHYLTRLEAMIRSAIDLATADHRNPH